MTHKVPKAEGSLLLQFATDAKVWTPNPSIISGIEAKDIDPYIYDPNYRHPNKCESKDKTQGEKWSLMTWVDIHQQTQTSERAMVKMAWAVFL